MDTEDTRVTREEAATLAGVSVREISRWRARGLLSVRYADDFRAPATYSRKEVEEAEALTRAEGRRIYGSERAKGEPDIST